MMGAKNIFYRYGIMVMIPIVFAVSKVSRTQFAGIICAELILLFLNNYSVYKTHIKGEQSPKKTNENYYGGHCRISWCSWAKCLAFDKMCEITIFPI